jgi:hypothetical protein
VAAKKTSMLEEVAATFLQDHTAEDPAERARVEAAGGIVQWRVDTWRVGHAAIQVTHGGKLPLGLSTAASVDDHTFQIELRINNRTRLRSSQKHFVMRPVSSNCLRLNDVD